MVIAKTSANMPNMMTGIRSPGPSAFIHSQKLLGTDCMIRVLQCCLQQLSAEDTDYSLSLLDTLVFAAMIRSISSTDNPRSTKSRLNSTSFRWQPYLRICLAIDVRTLAATQ